MYAVGFGDSSIMRNIIGQAVVGDDLYGRTYELGRLWELLEQGQHILMLAPRRVGKTSLMLELRRAPRENWDVFYVDVEGGEGPADFVAAILAALAAAPRYRTRFESIPFSNAVKNVLTRLTSVAVNIDVLRVELKGAMGREWGHAADHLQARLATLSDSDIDLLIIVDELPLLISRMLRSDGGHREVELLLSRLRHWRQAPELRGRVHTLVGGSIGLEGVLRRAGLSGLINDITPFRLEAWGRTTAIEFLDGVGRDSEFPLDQDSITHILELLGDPVPYHVQLFLSALRDACQGEPARISPNLIEQCFVERLAGAAGTAHLDHYATRLEIAFNPEEYTTARSILSHACNRTGVSLARLQDLTQPNETTFQSVLRDLQADGYLDRQGDHLGFRSNLLREWWGKHHVSGVTP